MVCGIMEELKIIKDLTQATHWCISHVEFMKPHQKTSKECVSGKRKHRHNCAGMEG